MSATASFSNKIQPTNKPQAKPVYFPGLNGLRGIAALSIIVLHTNQFLPILFHIPPVFASTDVGHLLLVLFFVLSGFLITYLLLLEKETYANIDLKRFYIKRVLRIWPLYFLIVTIAVLLYPLYKHLPLNPVTLTEFRTSLILFLTVFPNVAAILRIIFTPLRPLWSIGVEEQYYLMWPMLMKKVKNLQTGIICFIILYMLLVLAFQKVAHKSETLHVIYAVLKLSPFHIIALGGLGACIVHNKHFLLKWFYNRGVQIAAIACWLISYFYMPPMEFMRNEMFAVVFLIIVINTATNTKPLVSFNNKMINYVGKISYGIYMYHLLIAIALYLLFPRLVMNGWLIILIVFAATIIIATASYYLFERKFLKIKRRYTRIESSGESGN